ncbi:hypothetical protein [Pendulispora albinea]|uniref:Uncharacterized protein n=1 Tax=Pendulispora albinea TaxID=2741071 RepID=A0ABZ2LXF8_9BACT
MIGVDALAWALFVTENEVRQFVAGVADFVIIPTPDCRLVAKVSEERLENAFRRAWERDESGWRSAAYSRAQAMIDNTLRRTARVLRVVGTYTVDA